MARIIISGWTVSSEDSANGRMTHASVPADVRATDAENLASQRGQLAVLVALREKYAAWGATGS